MTSKFWCQTLWHERTQINILLVGHLLKPTKKNAADIFPVENDAQCPQPTQSLGPGTLSNLFGSRTVLNTCTFIININMTQGFSKLSKPCYKWSNFFYCDIKTVISCNWVCDLWYTCKLYVPQCKSLMRHDLWFLTLIQLWYLSIHS